MEPHSNTAMDAVNMIGLLADLKDDLYRNSLLLSSILELLLNKQVFTLQDLQATASQLDHSFSIQEDVTPPGNA
jgi:hypothetical protein